MRYRERTRRMPIVLAIGLFSAILLLAIYEKTKFKTFYIKQDKIDNARDTVIVSGLNGYTGRFPDVISTKNGLIAVYYWNDIHAPYVLGDHLGTIKIQKGTSDGENWESSVDLIDSDFLVKNGLGLWKSGDTFYYSKSDAEANNAEFCIEARDPNLARMGNLLIMTFFTRLPWNAGQNGYSYLQYDENYDYTYGRTFIMVSDDEGNTWSPPVEIKSEYLDRGSAKRGNIAVLDEHTILIPLYGYNSTLGNTFTTTNILAVFENGEWNFQQEYCIHVEKGDSVAGAFEKGVTEVSFTTLDQKIYALLRSSGNIMVSEDRGATWQNVKCTGQDESYVLHQPSLQTIEASKQILASWAEPNENGGRDIFLMLYSPRKDKVWRYANKFCIYHNDEGGDMADPTSILLSDNTVLTIYYDVQKQIVACTKTNLY